MITGKTSKGFEFEIEEEILDDWNLAKALNNSETNPFKATEILEMLLGKEQLNRLLDSLRNEKGRVKFSDASAVLTEIFQVSSKVKNS